MGLAAVALGVRHRATNDDIRCAAPRRRTLETLVIAGAVLASISKVTECSELRASMPTQRWKQVPVSCPRERCILFCMTRSRGLCRNVQEPVDPLAGEGRDRGRELGLADARS